VCIRLTLNSKYTRALTYENLWQDEEEILDAFMTDHSEQVGKKKFRCELDGKTFTSEKLLRKHFEENYMEEAMEWYQEVGGMGGDHSAKSVP